MSQTPDDLGQKIKAARERQRVQSGASDTEADGKDASGAASALRVATDLVAALGVGAFLGYWLDEWLGTRPLFMVVMFFLGFAAGFLNIYRAQMGKDYEIGFKSMKKDLAGDDKNTTKE